ncbi:MAG: hypothetical protein AB1489_25080, partial [Acidobacteriota bacterium]
LLSSNIGLSDMDISDPGCGMPKLSPDTLGTILGLEGVLRTSQTQSTVWPDQVRLPFQQALGKILNAPEESVTEVLAPPIYGRWQAAQRTVSANGPLWLQELNLDPRYRVAAGFGAMVIKQQQEQLIASAWQQLGEIENCNRLLRQAQLAREISSSIYQRRIKQLSADQFMKVTQPIHTKVRIGLQTAREKVRESLLPETVLSVPLRKISGLQGSIAKRLKKTGNMAKLQLVERLAKGEIATLPLRTAPQGMVSMDDVFQTLPTAIKSRGITKELLFKNLTPQAVQTVTAKPNLSINVEGILAKKVITSTAVSESADATLFRKAAIANLTHLTNIVKPVNLPRKPLEIPQIQTSLLDQLNPSLTILGKVRQRISTKENIWARKDPLEPVMAHPEFPQPMYEPLRELAKDLFLPGLDKVPPNTISLVEANTRFIEAYMIGLNYEMGRELLWREYPTDQRGTYFRQFWDVSGTLSSSTALQRESLKDIKPIHTWRSDKHLGENISGPLTTGLLILLIRGELLRRYTNAIIYAVKAVWSKDRKRRELTTEERYPLFRGDLPPDVIFLGFNLTKEEAYGTTDPNGSPGWFFVIQQQPCEPRFGLDEVNLSSPHFGGNPLSRNNLSWSHMVTNEQEYQALTHARALGRLSGIKIENANWGNNSAHMAFLTLQNPVRIAVHADTLLDK